MVDHGEGVGVAVGVGDGGEGMAGVLEISGVRLGSGEGLRVGRDVGDDDFSGTAGFVWMTAVCEGPQAVRIMTETR